MHFQFPIALPVTDSRSKFTDVSEGRVPTSVTGSQRGCYKSYKLEEDRAVTGAHVAALHHQQHVGRRPVLSNRPLELGDLPRLALINTTGTQRWVSGNVRTVFEPVNISRLLHVCWVKEPRNAGEFHLISHFPL